MNITEANDTNTLLRAALDAGAITPGRSLDAAVQLADRAYKALHAGLDGEQVREACGITQQQTPTAGQGETR